MEFTQTISIKWNTEGLNLDSSEISQLEEAGFERAYEMIKKGYNQGELNELTQDSEKNELEVGGWWSVSYK